MKDLLYMRWLHMKRQLFSILFWLFIPFIATIVLVQLLDVVKDDTSIPVGFVLQEETPLALELAEKLEEESFFTIHLLSEKEALNQLEKHELDSVFIVREGYDEKMEKGNRHKLIHGYESDMSFAYVSTIETIQSLVQQQASRYKAANEVEKLYRQFDMPIDVSEEELIERSKEIEAERTLLHTSMKYKGDEQRTSDAASIFSPMFIWVFISFLTTFFLFDWVIKEKNAHVATRFLFTRKSVTTYLFEHFILYTIGLFIIDVIAFFIFHLLYNEQISWKFFITLFICRYVWNSSAFLISLWIKRPFIFYLIGLSITFVAIVTYVIGIAAHSKLFTFLHPMEILLQGNYMNVWFLLNSVLLIIIFIRKEDSYVART
ncbi:MAG TPA: ABC transporter permease [Candidatus Pseudogracilibacillus intestinigallinarum]|uniref:ABC transporter permease n=1 Tax=Candidatus Pseudogracilibacillus intestinigallinarum TaxID=2838742 RepID=A0A9D1TJ65_9BACI|nr:ABC transporter permease [Candidatus Pseudogracilibacillus intestinigallinarum]